MGLTVGYETKNGLEIKRKFGNNVQKTQQNKTNSIKQTSSQVASLGNTPASDSFVSSLTGSVGSGNACTDGRDDGHISLLSKATNIVQGAARSVTNMAKAAIQHPFKTAGILAVGFVPVVGPAILGGLAVYGACQGTKEVVNAVKLANAADNDADAKAAWEHIGSGAFTTALSVTGAKATAKALNNQLSGGSATVNSIRNGMKKPTDILSSAYKETIQNGRAFIDTMKTKFNNAKKSASDSVKEFKESRELGEGKEYIKEKAQNYLDKKRYGETAKDVQSARAERKNAKTEFDNASKALEEAKAQNADTTEAQKIFDEANTKLNGLDKNSEAYKAAETKFKEATKEVGENSQAYKEAKAEFEKTTNGAEQNYKTAKKNTIKVRNKAQRKMENEAYAENEKFNNKKALEQSKEFANEVEANGDIVERYDSGAIKSQKYHDATANTDTEIHFDKNGKVLSEKVTNNTTGETTETLYDGKTSIKESVEGHSKKVTRTQKDGTSSETTNIKTKSGATKETHSNLDAKNKRTFSSTEYTGKLNDGSTINYKKEHIRNVNSKDTTVETYTTADGNSHTYTDGKLTKGSELTPAQRKLLEYNAKHNSANTTTIDPSALYAQQAAAALNTNRY